MTRQMGLSCISPGPAPHRGPEYAVVLQVICRAQIWKWGHGVVSPGRWQPPRVSGGLGCMTLGLEVKLLTALACSEFSDLVVWSRHLASFKIHHTAFCTGPGG